MRNKSDKIATAANGKIESSCPGKIESEKRKKKSIDQSDSGRVFVRADFGNQKISSFAGVAGSQRTLTEHHLKPIGHGNGQRARADDGNVDFELQPLEIELNDPEDFLRHDKITDPRTSQEPRLASLRRNDKMDVYNELKLSVLNRDRKLKDKPLDFGDLNQMAYAPHYYGQEEDAKPLKPVDERGVSVALHPAGLYSKGHPHPRQFEELLLAGDLCDTSEEPDAAAAAATCTSCCKSFDTRDLAFVFLFGLVVGLLAIIAATILYTAFFMLRKSCCPAQTTPYEITLTRDHHYRESSPDECPACKKCKKCCTCASEPRKKRPKMNPRAAMRVILISVYIFINLLMFGMCGYIYIVWSHYWRNRHRYLYPPHTVKPARHQEKHTLVEYFDENITASPATLVKLDFAPTFPNATQYGANYLADRRMLLEFKRKVIIKLRSVLLEESTLTRHQKENPYDVDFVEPMHNHDRSPQALLCELRKIMGDQLRQLRPEDVEDAELRGALTKRLLFEEGEHYEKCAIVSNAGALRHSYLGAEIDRHDLVLRFNHAPTQDYEVDVGSKTTIRIVNSQVASKPEFDFTNSALYKNIKILIWDPMPFRATIKFWLQNPEHNFFASFIQYKRQHPDSNVAIVNPEELWKLWAYLQQHTFSKLRLNPPSSGFLGLALLLPHCSSVNMFEFVPSHRMTSTCHYFSALIDPTCTTGVWHPLAAEKLLDLSLNTASDETVFNKGYVTIAGYSKLKC